MKQTSWFDWLEERDPIYVELQKLIDESTIYIAPFTIRKNAHGLYEIESHDTFDCCGSIEKCYRYLSEYSAKV
ncbi:hypothetical protein EQV77_15915 [Halobacillus fulvus]|nr:hypothetical protein EQV77_15915 [Halobacillus fulvus]